MRQTQRRGYCFPYSRGQPVSIFLSKFNVNTETTVGTGQDVSGEGAVSGAVSLSLKIIDQSSLRDSSVFIHFFPSQSQTVQYPKEGKIASGMRSIRSNICACTQRCCKEKKDPFTGKSRQLLLLYILHYIFIHY